MYTYREIEVSLLNEDLTLSYHLHIKPLTAIKSSLVIPVSPLLLHPIENGFLLIDGFARYHSAQSGARKTIPAYISSHPQPLYTFIDGIIVNSITSPLSVIEQCLALKILMLYFKQSLDQVKKELSETLTIPLQHKFNEFYQLFFLLKTNILSFLAPLSPSFKQLSHFLVYPDDIINALLYLAEQFHVKIKDSLFLLDQLFRIKQYKKHPDLILYLQNLIKDTGIQNLTGDKKLTKLKEVLYSENFPNTSHKRIKIDQEIKNSSFKKDQLSYDLNLENDELNINMKLKTISDWDVVLSMINQKKTKDSVHQILKLIND